MGFGHVPVLQKNVISEDLLSWIKLSTAQPGLQEPCKSYLRNRLIQALSVNQGIDLMQGMEVELPPDFFTKFDFYQKSFYQNYFSAPSLGAEHHICGWELMEGILNMWASNLHIDLQEN